MDNQRDVLIFAPDLFFQTKILATAKAVGASIRLLPSAEALLTASREQPDSLVVLDLGARENDPIEIIQTAKKDSAGRRPLIIGFYSHVDRELERRAREAGCDLVLPKSAFTRRLPEILSGRI